MEKPVLLNSFRIRTKTQSRAQKERSTIRGGDKCPDKIFCVLTHTNFKNPNQNRGRWTKELQARVGAVSNVFWKEGHER